MDPLDGLVDELLTPALVVRLDRARANVDRIVALAGGDASRWRPHVKTTKIPAVWRELLRAGVRHFKCATTREAAVLLELLEAEGIDGDVLLAQPLVGPALRRLGDLAREHPRSRVGVLCEDVERASEVPGGVAIFLELNPGMDRTGIPLPDETAILAVARAAGERLAGVHFYDGHLHDPDPDLRRERVFRGYDALIDTLEVLEDDGHAVREVVTAGTPAFPFALEYGGFRGPGRPVHRISPGTVVFHDLRSVEENPDVPLEHAATVLSRVVSHPRAERVTCDAGSKSIAAEAGEPVAAVVGHPELVPETPSEEHLPLRVTSGPRPPRGTLLHLVPRHVCPTVNLADEAVLVDGDEVRVVPVAARGHETRLPR